MAATLLPRVIALLAAALLLTVGLSTYTLPNHGGGSYQDLRDLIGSALGDARPSLPGPPNALPIHSDSTLRPMIEAGDTQRAGPPEWIRLAVESDSAELRGWLGRTVLVTAEARGDTIQTTLWRLTLGRSCPFLSRMHATSTGWATGVTRFVAVNGDCPAVAGRDSRR